MEQTLKKYFSLCIIIIAFFGCNSNKNVNKIKTREKAVFKPKQDVDLDTNKWTINSNLIYKTWIIAYDSKNQIELKIPEDKIGTGFSFERDKSYLKIKQLESGFWCVKEGEFNMENDSLFLSNSKSNSRLGFKLLCLDSNQLIIQSRVGNDCIIQGYYKDKEAERIYYLTHKK